MIELGGLPAVPGIWCVIAAVIGLCVGSFLNVVIHRLPKMLEQGWADQCAELRGEAPGERPRYNLFTPRSACPHCKHSIGALENIPVISYLFQRGKCKHCGGAISARYPVVEIAATALAVAAAWRFGPTVQSIAIAGLLWMLLTLSVIDIDTQLLPDNLTLPLLWAGLIVNSFGILVPIQDALWGAVAGYLVLWLIYWIFKLTTGKEGMGYGDFKLLAAIGAWLGWKMLLPTILISAVVGAVAGIAILSLQKKGRSTPISFGPFLAAAGWLMLMFGQDLVDRYLGLYARHP